MYTISDDEIEFILDDIEKKGIATEDVRYNILDHVCCIIENEMPNGEDFKKFYRNTIARFYRKELKEIEDETKNLLTFKYYYAMKRTIKITGAITAILILIGALFKAMHWPGAGITLVLSMVVFSLVFIPLNIIMKFRDDEQKSNRLIMTLGLLTATIGTLGILFKVMHWPGANIMFFGSFALFAILFIPVYFFSKFKDPETKFNAVIHTTFMIAACGMLFMLYSLKPSKNIQKSVESVYDFQEENVIDLETNNTALYEQMSTGNLNNVEKIHELTNQLNNQIVAIKSNLIAHSNKINVEEATGMGVSDLKNPNDFQVIESQFSNADGDLSYQALKSSVQIYNEGIDKFDAKYILRPINIDELIMTKTIVSVVLHGLGEIQMLLLSNENSYLSLNKGFIAER